MCYTLCIHTLSKLLEYQLLPLFDFDSIVSASGHTHKYNQFNLHKQIYLVLYHLTLYYGMYSSPPILFRQHSKQKTRRCIVQLHLASHHDNLVGAAVYRGGITMGNFVLRIGEIIKHCDNYKQSDYIITKVEKQDSDKLSIFEKYS